LSARNLEIIAHPFACAIVFEQRRVQLKLNRCWQLLNAGGASVSGAILAFTDGNLRSAKTVVTDSSGAYNSNWIAVGSYTITVSASGYAGTSANATVSTGLTTSLDFTLQP